MLEAEFTDGNTLDVTEVAEWSVDVTYGFGSPPVNASNRPGSKGLVTTIDFGVATLRVTYLGVEATLTVNVSAT